VSCPLCGASTSFESFFRVECTNNRCSNFPSGFNPFPIRAAWVRSNGNTLLFWASEDLGPGDQVELDPQDDCAFYVRKATGKEPHIGVCLFFNRYATEDEAMKEFREAML
jgi:hypothetical protein